jgi:hypothetical protein
VLKKTLGYVIYEKFEKHGKSLGHKKPQEDGTQPAVMKYLF